MIPSLFIAKVKGTLATLLKVKKTDNQVVTHASDTTTVISLSVISDLGHSFTRCHTFMSMLMQGNPDLVPSVLTLALNDAITYDKVRNDLHIAYLPYRKKVKTYVDCY